MRMAFYSDRVNGPAAPVNDYLPEVTARGLVGLVRAKIASNWLARSFPKHCYDGPSVFDTDTEALVANLQALVPAVSWPLEVPMAEEVVFDLIEYTYARVAQPVHAGYHDYFRHYELDFDEKAGRKVFRSDVNQILRRGAVMYELLDNGEVHRRGTPEVRNIVERLDPATGDDRLDELLHEARSLYTSRAAPDRAIAVERMWDAFERLKTIDLPGGDKKRSVRALLNHLDAGWRPVVEAEMEALTRLGNEYEIRHFETRAKALPSSVGDYLFARMGALVTELLSASDRLRTSDSEHDWA